MIDRLRNWFEDYPMMVAGIVGLVILVPVAVWLFFAFTGPNPTHHYGGMGENGPRAIYLRTGEVVRCDSSWNHDDGWYCWHDAARQEEFFPLRSVARAVTWP